jgi:diaminohydroxyphosphoribosylaminopyrimidine deaminase/5-amino-6-(5-phosphoribosylamino)uracil reductase
MRRAIALAARGLGATHPNPVVGCVLVDGAGEVVGEGFHARAGGPHAEIVALDEAGERALGATAVVSLEPCNHTGRTGPCARALIDAGVRRVVIAVDDPTRPAGGGTGTLRAAGVDVVSGVLREEAERGNVVWLTAVRRGRPYLIWKFAATLDGRSAAADGTSKWITSAEARADVHRLRGTVDAIVAGVGTVLADDAQLTVRLPVAGQPGISPSLGEAELGEAEVGEAEVGARLVRQPLRVVVDSSGRTPQKARVRDDSAPTWIATAAEVGRGPDGRTDLNALMAALFDRGVRSALLEGGPTLAGAFLAAGLVDQVTGYVAPKLLGAGANALAAAGVTTIAEAIDLAITDVTRIGPDLRFTATLRQKES